MRISVLLQLLLVILLPLCVFCTGFFGNHHFKGGNGESRQQSSSKSQSNDNYYKVLGLRRDSSPNDIKRAYRKQAMQLHPDKGGDEEDFKLLSEAYEVLSDPSKKRMYDRYGKEAVTGNGASTGAGGMGMQFEGFPPDFADIFRSFSSGFSVPLVYNIQLTLDELYAGQTISVSLDGMPVEVEIEPGMYEGTELRGEIVGRDGNKRDLIFVVQEQEHPVYARRNADLFAELFITLEEALLGFEKNMTFIDGSKFIVKSVPGSITSPDEVLVLEGMGMPVYSAHKTRLVSSGARGRLFLSAKVIFPQKQPWKSEKDKKVLRELLKDGTSTSIVDHDSSSAIDDTTNGITSKDSNAEVINGNKVHSEYNCNGDGTTDGNSNKSSSSSSSGISSSSSSSSGSSSSSSKQSSSATAKAKLPKIYVAKKGNIKSFGQCGRSEAAASASGGRRRYSSSSQQQRGRGFNPFASHFGGLGGTPGGTTFFFG